MQEVFHEAVNELTKGDPVVVATVVHTKGSTPQKPGAKLLVRHDGSGVGTLGGGCVEGDIWFAAKELLKRGGPAEYRDYELNEELAAEGRPRLRRNDVLPHRPGVPPGRVTYPTPPRSTERIGEKAPRALATLIKAADRDHGTAASTGSKLFIRENGATEGTLGLPELDREAVKKARELMVHGRNEYVTTDSGAQYFVEAYTTPPQLVLCGGGHVSKAISPLAKTLGFRVFITDDRVDFANPDRFPRSRYARGGKSPKTQSPSFQSIPTPSSSSLHAATATTTWPWRQRPGTPAKYVGLLGSRRKTILIYERPHAQRRAHRPDQGDPLTCRSGHPRPDPGRDRDKHHGRDSDVPPGWHGRADETRRLACRPHPRQGPKSPSPPPTSANSRRVLSPPPRGGLRRGAPPLRDARGRITHGSHLRHPHRGRRVHPNGPPQNPCYPGTASPSSNTRSPACSTQECRRSS